MNAISKLVGFQQENRNNIINHKSRGVSEASIVQTHQMQRKYCMLNISQFCSFCTSYKDDESQ